MKSEKAWQAEDDARSLQRAEEVKADKKRMAAAKKAAVNLAKEKAKELNNLKKIAKKR